MKKVLALTLASVMLASFLASCAAVPSANTSPFIRVTSSDAADAAAWLTERLGDKPTGRVVIGTDADAYGIELDELETDGFVIRSFGDEVALFARTADGLDRAARKYAKMIGAGTVEDVTYHEGCRVKKLTIAGCDVSGYAIVRESADDPCVTTAANTLAEYIERSCGAKLPVCTEAEFSASGRSNKIAISSGDEALGSDGFTITTDESGDLHIDGGVWRGSYYGVLDLLEDIGWRFLSASFYTSDPTVPQEYLYEADHIDLTSALDRTETPSIPIRGGAGRLKQRDTYSTYRNAAYGGYGFNFRCCHGLQNNHSIIFSGEYEGLYQGFTETYKTQPCFTNEDILEAIDHYALEYVRTRLDAGLQIGKEIIDVDVSQWDGGEWTFCKCKNCLKVKAEEGCITGSVMRMANRVCALLDENYPGMCASMLAYSATHQLPRLTRPAHNLYIAFAWWPCDGIFPCSNHPISSDGCGNAEKSVTNRAIEKYFVEWAAVVDPKMMQMWYYPVLAVNMCYNSPLLTTILSDIKYFASYHIEHIYFCMNHMEGTDNGVVIESLTEYIGAKAMWNADMSEEEGLALIREWFGLVYGEDAGGELYELAMFAERASDQAGCWFSYARGESTDRVSYEYVAKHAEEILSSCERAIRAADSADQEKRAEKYALGFKYMVLISLYDDMYVNGTESEREFIVSLYREIWEKFREYSIPPYFSGEVFTYAPETFDPDVDPHTWIES